MDLIPGNKIPHRFFKTEREPVYFHDIEKGYFQLVSEEYFNNVYPVFNLICTKDYSFRLARRQPNNFQVDFGSLLQAAISYITFGVYYYSFHQVLTHAQ